MAEIIFELQQLSWPSLIACLMICWLALGFCYWLIYAVYIIKGNRPPSLIVENFKILIISGISGGVVIAFLMIIDCLEESKYFKTAPAMAVSKDIERLISDSQKILRARRNRTGGA